MDAAEFQERARARVKSGLYIIDHLNVTANVLLLFLRDFTPSRKMFIVEIVEIAHFSSRRMISDEGVNSRLALFFVAQRHLTVDFL